MLNCYMARKVQENLNLLLHMHNMFHVQINQKLIHVEHAHPAKNMKS